MTKAELTSLINGGNIARYHCYVTAVRRATNQKYFTSIILGCDGRFWVPATPRIVSKLVAAGYDALPAC